MVLYKVLTISREFRVFLITLGLQPYIHREFDSCFVFFLIGLIDNILFLIFVFDPSLQREGNIVNHINGKKVGLVLPAVLCNR
jgi:hypothetical protein